LQTESKAYVIYIKFEETIEKITEVLKNEDKINELAFAVSDDFIQIKKVHASQNNLKENMKYSNDMEMLFEFFYEAKEKNIFLKNDESGQIIFNKLEPEDFPLIKQIICKTLVEMKKLLIARNTDVFNKKIKKQKQKTKKKVEQPEYGGDDEKEAEVTDDSDTSSDYAFRPSVVHKSSFEPVIDAYDAMEVEFKDEEIQKEKLNLENMEKKNEEENRKKRLKKNPGTSDLAEGFNRQVGAVFQANKRGTISTKIGLAFCKINNLSEKFENLSEKKQLECIAYGLKTKKEGIEYSKNMTQTYTKIRKNHEKKKQNKFKKNIDKQKKIAESHVTYSSVEEFEKAYEKQFEHETKQCLGKKKRIS
jgi:hypothetical protein